MLKIDMSKINFITIACFKRSSDEKHELNKKINLVASLCLIKDVNIINEIISLEKK